MKFLFDSMYQSLPFTFTKVFQAKVGHDYDLGGPFGRSKSEPLFRTFSLEFQQLQEIKERL